MIGQESGNLLREENHGEEYSDGSPEKELPDYAALYGALPGATLLPESHTDHGDGNEQEPRPKAQQKSAGAGSANGGGKAEGNTARHSGERTNDCRERGGETGAGLHGFSIRIASRTAR